MPDDKRPIVGNLDGLVLVLAILYCLAFVAVRWTAGPTRGGSDDTALIVGVVASF